MTFPQTTRICRPAMLRLLAVATVAMEMALGGCAKKDTLKTLERVPLPDSVPANATLTLDSMRRAWIGRPGSLTAFDSAGHALATLPVTLRGAPRLLWLDENRAYLRTDSSSAVVRLDSAGAAGIRRSDAPLARDPAGRWVYTATRTGSVLGLDPRTLVPKWGWPDAGSRVSALAVSPLGDRVYVALAGNGKHDVPTSVEVHDAFSGRTLSTWEAPDVVRALVPAPDGTLYALAGADVLALRHGAAGLGVVWSKGFGGIGGPQADALRVAPGGGRVAVLARGKELRVLQAKDGAVVEESKRAPRDAAWDAAGRLWVLGPREIRIVR
jgi:ribosomal protein L24E